MKDRWWFLELSFSTNIYNNAIILVFLLIDQALDVNSLRFSVAISGNNQARKNDTQCQLLLVVIHLTGSACNRYRMLISYVPCLVVVCG